MANSRSTSDEGRLTRNGRSTPKSRLTRKNSLTPLVAVLQKGKPKASAKAFLNGLTAAGFSAEETRALVEACSGCLGVRKTGLHLNRFADRSQLPRERLAREGVEALGDAELLTVLLGTGTREQSVLEVAETLLARYKGSLPNMVEAFPRDAFPGEGKRASVHVSGVGEARAGRLVAAFEIARRIRKELQEPDWDLRMPESVVDYLQAFSRAEAGHEGLVAVVLNRKMKTRSRRALYIPAVDTDPGAVLRAVFRETVAEDGCFVILARLDPAPLPTVTEEDRERARLLAGAGDKLRIPLLDVLVVGQGTDPSGSSRLPFISLRRTGQVNFAQGLGPNDIPVAEYDKAEKPHWIVRSGPSALPEAEGVVPLRLRKAAARANAGAGGENPAQPAGTREPARRSLPRERLDAPETLDDYELIAILLGAGLPGKNVLALSQEILQDAGGSLLALRNGLIADVPIWKGVGPNRTLLLLAAFELARRAYQAPVEPDAKADMRNPEHVVRYLFPCIVARPTEGFFVLPLDSRFRLRSHIRHQSEVFSGTADSSLVHARDVFQEAIRHKAYAIVVAHNHPTGDTAPSTQDLQVTRELIQAGKWLGIPVVDHIIIGGLPGPETDAGEAMTLPFRSLRRCGDIERSQWDTAQVPLP